jgi:DDE domain
VRFWWNRFGPMFAAEIRKKRVAPMRGYPQWRWHLDEVFVKVNGRLCYLWRAVDHEGEVLVMLEACLELLLAFRTYSFCRLAWSPHRRSRRPIGH